MIPAAIRLPAKARAALALALVLALALLLSSCGGGGVISAPATRPLPADFASRKAVAYSPFRTATGPEDLVGEVITPAMIKEDLDLLVAAGFGLIRTYDSSDKVAKQTLQVIRDHGLDLKVQLGVYVLSSDAAFSNAEVARAVALANEFKDIVIAVSVGNETMVSWSFNRFTTNAMVTYIKTVRDAVSQPVTTNDNWAFFAQAHPYEQNPGPILEVIDFVAMHTYPLLDTVYNPGTWDWQQAAVPADARARAMMDAALAAAKSEYEAVRAHMDSLGATAMPIVIGETGWKAPNAGPLNIPMRSHPVNQKMYFDDLQAWKAAADGPVNVFYFEAFDEQWKQGDDGWGLFNKARLARYVVKDSLPPSQWVPGDANEPATAGLTDADAVHYLPPVVNDPVTQNRYLIYTETSTTSDFRETGLNWDPFVKTFWQPVADAAPGDGVEAYEIDPRPETWGWGMLYQSRTGVTANLSQFAGGTINFSIKTTYPGRIEIGISSDTPDRTVVEAYLQIGNGDYGYLADGTWRQVSIPVSALLAANPKLDLTLVLSRVVIADRYAMTGKPEGSNVTTRLRIDGIHWSR
jgi:exo-beta-1,3-glucanase (GH17 family)